MTDERGDGYAFDPFRCNPLGIQRLDRLNIRWLFMAVPVSVALCALAALLTGRFGGIDDFQLVDDLRRVTGDEDVAPAEPNFPFMRDYPSQVLSVIVALTLPLVFAQWQRFRSAIPKMVANGAIEPVAAPSVTIGGPEVPDQLQVLIESINTRVFDRVARLSFLVFISAVLIAVILVIGEMTTGIFDGLAPRDLTGNARQRWLDETYDSWWASIDSVVGVVIYGAIAFVGIYVGLLQNIVGMTALWLIRRLPKVSALTYERYDADGQGGWRPMADAYRTVHISLILNATGLTIAVIALGVEDVLWLGALVILWVGVAPLYLFVPVVVFRKALRKSREAEIGELAEVGALAEENCSSEYERLICREAVNAAIDRIRSRKLSPLRVRGRVVSAAFAVVPVVLAVAEVWFSAIS